MPASIGVNLRVTGHCRQGGRKYMEDFFSVAYQQTEDERDLEYAFFGIYDGHGGAEAAAYAKEHLMELIVQQKNFWSERDDDVLKAIKEGFIATHYAMWREQAKWPKTASGLPSTAGTTASIAFIRRGKIYIGHVGDSAIVLGIQDPQTKEWVAQPLTKDHKPESEGEIQRIEQSGGKVVTKSGVPRVVWNRPRLGHQGPIRRSTPIDEIPFLAVARSLGDLWSYNSQLDEFVVSPDPDCAVIPINTTSFRCLIFGTDGLYNMLSSQMAVHIVQQAEKHNENAALNDVHNKVWINPSKCLVEKALERWSTTKMRADNTSVITLLLDPPGPPRAQVLQNRKRKPYPNSGLEIVTRYEVDAVAAPKRACTELDIKNHLNNNINVNMRETIDENILTASNMLKKLSAEYAIKNSPVLHPIVGSSDNNEPTTSKCTINEIGTSTNDIDQNFIPKTRESTSFDVIKSEDDKCSVNVQTNDENVQINEVSSSSNDSEEENAIIGEQVTVKKKHKMKTLLKRPILRSQNVKHLKKYVKPNNSENVNISRLRIRNGLKQPRREDQNANVSSSKDKTSLTSKRLEWLNVHFKTKNALKNKSVIDVVKKQHQNQVRRSLRHIITSESPPEASKKIVEKLKKNYEKPQLSVCKNGLGCLTRSSRILQNNLKKELRR